MTNAHQFLPSLFFGLDIHFSTSLRAGEHWPKMKGTQMVFEYDYD